MSKTYQAIPVDGLVQVPPVFVCAIGPDGNPVPAGGTSAAVSVSITRPANTTAYLAGDAIGIADAETPANAGSAILTFASMGPSGGLILITDVTLEIDVTAIPSGMAGFKLRLYNAAPAAILDNAAWDLIADDRSKYLGTISISTPTDHGSTLTAEMTQINKTVKLAGTSLYAVLTTDAGFTPSSGTVKKITLSAVAL